MSALAREPFLHLVLLGAIIPGLGHYLHERARRRGLVQKYEFLQEDLATPVEPTESQLREYYRLHPDRYLHSGTVTFTHVYFSTEVRGDSHARDAAQALASNLNRRGATEAVGQGNRFPGTVKYAPSEELKRVFGSGGLVEAIFCVELNHWSAPLPSGLGWHTVYVISRQPANGASFEEVRDNVVATIWPLSATAATPRPSRICAKASDCARVSGCPSTLTGTVWGDDARQSNHPA